MKKFRLVILYIIFSYITYFLFSNLAFASTSFVVDGSNGANSTGPCVGKTVCHISGDLTYSNITLKNGAKLSHRQGVLTVVNDFIIGEGSSSYFVGQDLNVGHLLNITNASVLSLNSNLTSEPTSTTITDWMGTSYYDLAVTNTDVLFDGLDVNLTNGGYIKTRNAVINSRFKFSSNSTNPIWTTYANGYISIDGDANIINVKMDIDGYMYVGGNLSTDFSGAAGYYMYIRGMSQVSTPLSTLFSNAGISVTGNLTFTGNITTPTKLYLYSNTGLEGDNIYVGENINMYKIEAGSTSTTSSGSLGNIESKNGYINLNSTNQVYMSADLKAKSDISLNNIPVISLQNIRSTEQNVIASNGTSLVSNDIIANAGNISITNITNQLTNDIISDNGNITVDTATSHTYRDITAKVNINISNISSELKARNFSNSGATLFSNILFYDRLGNINSTGNITLNSITTSSGSNTNITSTAGSINVSTGTTHTYRNLSSYSNNSITNISDYKANNISSNGKLLVTNSTIETTNTDDENNESKPNIDIATGSDFVITNSTANLKRSSVQVNGYLEVNNSPWVSQSLNINGFKTIDDQKVGIYFRGGKDRYIHGNIFAGGGSIWVGTSLVPDNGNILLFRNTQVITNGGLKMYRDVTTNVNRFDFLPSATITENSGIFSQLYNAAASVNGGVVSATGNLIVDTNKLIDSDSAGELVTTYDLDKFANATFGTAVFGGIKEEIVGGIIGTNQFGGAFLGTASFGGVGDFYAKKQGDIGLFGQALFGTTTINGYSLPISTGVEFTLARNMSLSKICISTTINTPTAVKLQFKDSNNITTNTQSIKMQTAAKGRQCFDINTVRAKKVYVTGYPETTIGFKEVELRGVPTDVANISVSLNDDILLSNGSYELGGNITSRNLTITSTSNKKARVIQYSQNGVFDAKSNVNLTNTTAGNTILTHSVGNELGLKFVTDTMSVGPGVLIDTTGKGYLGGNSISELTTTNGGTGNILPGTLPMRAGDGGAYGGIGGYGVSGGGGGGSGGGLDGLYSFSSHTFTNCGQTGRTGPSLSSCKTAYSTTWDENASYFGMTTNGIQEWTVPQSGIYRISAQGAGKTNQGKGALIEGDVELYVGQKIKILVGQQGLGSSGSDTPGAGGTFISTIDNQPIIVAGGGGGYYTSGTPNNQESGGRTTTGGGNGYTPWYGYAYGGTNGNGGAYISSGGGGAGFYGNGGGGGTVAQSFTNGGVGGIRSREGGFGGGADTTSWGGGGGGGYSGGGGSYNGGNGTGYGDGGGGGSYNAGANKNEISGYNGGQGSVTITKISGKLETDAVAGAGGGNLGYGGNGGSTTCTGSLGNNELGNTRGGKGGGVNGGSGTNWHGGGGMNLCTGGGGGTGGNSDTNPYRLGSGGGAGGLLTDDFNTGYGGNGGGMIRISANRLYLNGKLIANGQVGKNYKTTNDGMVKYGAGGGGAGGSILIRAKALNCDVGNSIEVKGGTGGAGISNDLGGGGGGGGVITYYYTEKEGTCAGILTKGLAGASGGGAAGQDGLAYESAGSTFDTLRSRVLIEDSPAEADGTQEIIVKAYFLDVNGVPLEGEYLIAEVIGSLGSGQINNGNPLPQTDANGFITFPITSTVKGIKKVILKNAITYTELQEQPTITFGVPSISIEKVANKSTVNSGDVVTYTITVTNSGSGDAGGDVENAVIVEDVLPTGFRYYTTGPTAGSKWDTGTGTTQYYIFPETSGDGTSGNEERLRYTITDGISGPAYIPGNGGKVRIVFDTKVP